MVARIKAKHGKNEEKLCNLENGYKMTSPLSSERSLYLHVATGSRQVNMTVKYIALHIVRL